MLDLSNDLLRRYIVNVLRAPLPEPGKLHLIGLRSARVIDGNTITRVAPLPDQYDDVMVCFGTHLQAFPCTVDPGLRYNLRPINPKGTAHLCNGGPYSYRKGLHRGKPGLVQWDAVRVWRDANRNGRQDPGEQPQWVTGTGINIHRGGTSARVDAWSAGCQVIPMPIFLDFWRVIEGSGQKAFDYYLGNASELL